jgi:hypothetical protein
MHTRDGAASGELDAVVRQKLEAFEAIERDFRESFRLVAAFHGERRLERVPVGASVRYLRALWICDCKDRLLDAARSIRRYEGRRCLELLLAWQRGQSAGVVIFLSEKLGDAPIAELTRQITLAEISGDAALAGRLSYGRQIALNRSFNLAVALEAILGASPEELRDGVTDVCRELDLGPERIAEALTAFDSPIYGHVRHPLLARRNMLLMNALGEAVTNDGGPLRVRTSRVLPAASPHPARSETPVVPVVTMVSMAHNNPADLDLAMPLATQDAPGVFGEEDVRFKVERT